MPAAGGSVERLKLPTQINRVVWPRGIAGQHAVLAGVEYKTPESSGIFRIDLEPSLQFTRIVPTPDINEMTAVLVGSRRLAWSHAGALVST